jgi:hypothetical protein
MVLLGRDMNGSFAGLLQQISEDAGLSKRCG